MTSLAPILQGFFTQKMITQKQASPHTVASYRDAFRLLLTYAQQVTGTPPWRMQLSQLDHDLIAGFLQHLKTDRGNSAATCNARLAAIHSMFRYAALHAPEDAAVIQRVMAISGSRTTSTDISWLTSAEADALLAAPDRGTWTGRRDHCLILVALRTGLRVSELIQLTLRDVHLDTGPHVRVTGKGRKERCTPLDKPTVAVLSAWLTERAGQPGDPLLCTRRGRPLSPDAIQARLGKYHAIAAGRCPSLADKTLSPHVLRHTTAMTLKIGRIAFDASFGSSREHALPAAQRAALRSPRPARAPRGCDDLGLHGPPMADATMMRLMPLRGVHHRCAC